MAEPKPVYRVLVTARDRAAMLALLHRHKLDIGGSPRYSADGAVRIEAYVPADGVAELEADGARVEIVADETATNRDRQLQVGLGNRFLTGDPVPHGVGRKVRDRDVS